MKLDEIENLISNTYQKNLLFFQQNYSDIYNIIVNTKEENYFLEYNEFFNIVSSKGEFLYKIDPFIEARQKVNDIFKYPSGILTIDTNLRDEKEYIFNSNRFLNEFIKLIPSFKEENLKFKKFIFSGTLLGIHIQEIDKKIKAKAYLIVEENIEIFRLSLFLCDYSSINGKLFFSIGEINQNIIEDFFEYNYWYNSFIKFDIANHKDVIILDEILNIISSLDPFIFAYSESIKNYIHTIYNVKNNKLLYLPQNIKLKKIVFIAPGPSLDKNIDFIKTNKDKILIASTLSSLKKLININIYPDIIISVDNDRGVLKSLNFNLNILDKSIFILSTNTHLEVVSYIKKYTDNIYFIHNSFGFLENTKALIGESVGDLGVKILLELGIKEIYLIGIDAALSDDGLTHTNMHISSEKKDTKQKTILDDNKVDFGEKIIEVEGNLKKVVKTTLFFNRIIEIFKTINLNNQKIYNLSDGAKLPNTIPLEKDKIIFDKNYRKKIKFRYRVGFSSRDLKILQGEYITLKNNSFMQYDLFTKGFLRRYDRLILPYYYFLLDNFNIDTKDIIEKQKNIIISSLKKALKEVLDGN